MRRTWASLLAAGALVCGCGGAQPSRPVRAARHAVRTFTRTHVGGGLSGRCDVVALPGAFLGDVQGRLSDLTPYVRARRQDFFAAALAAGAAHGRQVAIPQSVSVEMLLHRSGLRPPATWEALYSDRRPGHAVMSTGDASGASAIGEVAREFSAGKGGFMPLPSGFAADVQDRHMRVGRVPHFAGQLPRPLLEAYVLAVPRPAPNRLGGIALLDWLTRLNAMPFVVGDGLAPPLKAVYADPQLLREDPVLSAIPHALPHAVTYPPLRHAPAVLDAVGRDVHAALAGDAGVDQALRRLTRDIDAIVAPGATA